MHRTKSWNQWSKGNQIKDATNEAIFGNCINKYNMCRINKRTKDVGGIDSYSACVFTNDSRNSVTGSLILSVCQWINFR